MSTQDKAPVAPEAQQQIQIPDLPVNLPMPVVQLILRGLRKLPAEESMDAIIGLTNVADAHINRCVAAHQAAAAAPKPPGKVKPVAAAAKTVAKRKR